MGVCEGAKETFNDWGGGQGCHNFVPVSGGDGTKIAPPGDLFDQPPGKMSWQACRPFREPCSLVPGRGYFGDLLGDGIVVSPPPPIAETLEGGCMSFFIAETKIFHCFLSFLLVTLSTVLFWFG